MNNSRLFEILFYLLRHRKASATVLAEEFDVSVRTIYRDMDVLSSAGIPIVCTTGRNGGIYLMDGYVIDRLFITEQEQQDMLLALKSLEATQFINTDQLLKKLGIVFQRGDTDSIVVDFARWGSDTSSEQVKFDMIKQAINQKRCMDILYINGMGEEIRRRIEPLKLLFKESAWYLFSFCHIKNDYRLFRLSRIMDYSIADENYEREHDLGKYMAESVKYYGELIHLVLRADATVKHRLLDVFASDAVSTDEHGNVRVEVDIPNSEWLVSFALSLGDNLQSIEPDHLRKSIMEQHRRALQKMKGTRTDGE